MTDAWPSAYCCGQLVAQAGAAAATASKTRTRRCMRRGDWGGGRSVYKCRRSSTSPQACEVSTRRQPEVKDRRARNVSTIARFRSTARSCHEACGGCPGSRPVQAAILGSCDDARKSGAIAETRSAPRSLGSKPSARGRRTPIRTEAPRERAWSSVHGRARAGTVPAPPTAPLGVLDPGPG